MTEPQKNQAPNHIINSNRYIPLKSLIKETSNTTYNIKELQKCILVKNKIKS